jgi:hypothetical protein
MQLVKIWSLFYCPARCHTHTHIYMCCPCSVWVLVHVSIKADFQSSHEAPRSSLRVHAWALSSNHNAKQLILIRCKHSQRAARSFVRGLEIRLNTENCAVGLCSAVLCPLRFSESDILPCVALECIVLRYKLAFICILSSSLKSKQNVPSASTSRYQGKIDGMNGGKVGWAWAVLTPPYYTSFHTLPQPPNTISYQCTSLKLI